MGKSGLIPTAVNFWCGYRHPEEGNDSGRVTVPLSGTSKWVLLSATPAFSLSPSPPRLSLPPLLRGAFHYASSPTSSPSLD